MSMRGVATGWAGSAAVLLVAAVSLGAVRAQADAARVRKAAPAVIVVTPDQAPPAQARSLRSAILRPAWLRRLLSPSDLEPSPPRG